jgi:hypothetical protein
MTCPDSREYSTRNHVPLQMQGVASRLVVARCYANRANTDELSELRVVEGVRGGHVWA